ncbi:MAG: phosphoglucosamine mutase, partial [Alphaproteobacteria bacterium]
KPASAVLRRFAPVPQILRNHRFDRAMGDPLDSPAFREALRAAERRLGESGRLVVRKSGTEPVIRLMAEGDDAALIEAVLDDLQTVLDQAAAA